MIDKTMVGEPQPVGYVGKASLDMMQAGQTAACAMTPKPPKVDEFVALYAYPAPETNMRGGDE